MTLCYLVALLCGVLAYIIYGLHINICPPNKQGYPYSDIIDGTRKPIERSDIVVFGQLFPFDITQHFMKARGINLTNDFKGVELGPLFNIDTQAECLHSQYARMTPCAVTNAQGMITVVTVRRRRLIIR